jgi:hypothetical protein
MAQAEPKQYSIYQKVQLPDGRTQWVGTHRLPISSALKAAREMRDNGYRVVWRLDGEYGPQHKD